MDILHRFALIIHWFSFIVGTLASFFFIYFFYLNLTDSISVDASFNWQFFLWSMLLIPFAFVSCNGLGWLFRFVISGKVHFLPWRN